MSATQLQHLNKKTRYSQVLSRLYLKREFEMAPNKWLLWCTCILFFGRPYFLYIILACTEVNNGIWRSLYISDNS